MIVRRRQRINILCLLTYIVLPCVLLVAIHHVSVTYTISRLSDGTFGFYNPLVYFESLDMTEDALFLKLWDNNEMLHDISYAVFQNDTIEDFDIRYLYFNNKYVSFPMLEGRFFQCHDFVLHNNSAVIGKNYLSNVYLREGKKYIRINDVEFSILGVLGYEKDSVLDNWIYINAFSDLPSEKCYYHVDCLSGDNIEETLELYLEHLKMQGYENEIITESYSYADSVTVKIDAYEWFKFLILAAIMSIILVSLQWIRMKKREILIKKFVGATNTRLIFELLSNLFIYIGLSFSFVYVICKIFYPDYTVFLGVIYGVTGIIIAFISIISICILLGSSLKEVINL